MEIKDLFSPKAKEILTNEIFWDLSNEFAPFGSDEGFDGFWCFEKWLRANPSENVMVYLRYLASYFRLEFNQIYQTRISDLENRNLILIEDFDDEIIAVCFGQLILQGFIQRSLLRIGTIALERQATTFVLHHRMDSEDLKAERKMILEILLVALDRYEASNS